MSAHAVGAAATTRCASDTTPTACPHCGMDGWPTKRDAAGRVTRRACHNCAREYAEGEHPVSPRRPTLEDRVADLLEKDIVAAAVRAGQDAGYIVAEIGQRRAKGSGTTEGVGDTLWTRPGDPRWLMQEAKTATGRLRPAQQKLVDAGCMVVYRSASEALENADAVFGRSERDG